MTATLLVGSFTLRAQAPRPPAEDTTLPLRKIFIVRPSEFVGALAKIRVNVNGQVVSFPNNSYAALQYRADSVILRIDNKRVSGESVQPLVTFKAESYFVAMPEEHAHKKDRLILTEVEKDSYDKYALKVTHQVKAEQ
jgi:hypothetical protein